MKKERGSMICYVVVTHNDSGRRYVGITKSTLSIRKSDHESQAKNRSHNSKLHDALWEYGNDAFSWDLLAEGRERVMRLLERILIHEWETNGPGGVKGGVHVDRAGAGHGAVGQGEDDRDRCHDSRAWRSACPRRSTGQPCPHGPVTASRQVVG